MSDDIAISVQNVSKAYRIWRDPSARLKAPLWGAIGKYVPSFLLNLNSKLKRYIGNSGRYYRDFYALNEVTFNVRRGESFAIIGRNGSGKSTLLQIIAGTLTPSSGKVIVRGRIAALLELGNGFNPDFTGRENVYLNAAILGLTRADIDSRMDSILSFADIGEFINQPVKTYSSGMTMRLAFSVLTAVDPDILIVDEALAVGDIFFVQKCMDKIRELKARGCTLLFVSHSMGTVIELCERAALLTKGDLKYIGTAKETVDLYDYEHVASLSGRDNNCPSAGSAAVLVDCESELIERCRKEAAIQPDSTRESLPASLAFIRSFDAEGVERSLLTTDTKMFLIMGFLLRDDQSDPVLGLKLRDKRGQTIYETSTHTLGYAMPGGLAGQLYIGGFRLCLPLTPGEYTLTAGLAAGRLGTSDYRQILVYQHDVHRIEICWPSGGHSPWAGVCNLSAIPLLPART